MTNQEVAQKYLEYFCAGKIDDVASLLAPNLTFTGTLQTFGTAAEYITSLKDDPPGQCDFNILSITESNDSVAIFYEYIKPEGVVQISQLFTIADGRIKEILLIFDGRGCD